MALGALHAALDVRVDGDVELTLAVSNRSADPRELRFRDGQPAEFEVRRDGEPVWRWSDDRAFVQAVRTETLPPGGLLEFSAAWSAPEPGAYRAVATLLAADVDLEASATFEA